MDGAALDIYYAGLAMTLPSPKRRGKPLLPAAPLSLFVRDCTAFLARIDRIQITRGTKKQFTLRVTLRTRTNDTRVVSFEIARSSDEVHALQRAVVEACRQHPSSTTTGLEPCTFCEPLKILPPLPETTERLWMSAAKIHTIVEDRLALFVAGAVGTPSLASEYYCEGQVSVPVLVRNFLLHGVDDVALLK